MITPSCESSTTSEGTESGQNGGVDHAPQEPSVRGLGSTQGAESDRGGFTEVGTSRSWPLCSGCEGLAGN